MASGRSSSFESGAQSAPSSPTKVPSSLLPLDEAKMHHPHSLFIKHNLEQLGLHDNQMQETVGHVMQEFIKKNQATIDFISYLVILSEGLLAKNQALSAFKNKIDEQASASVVRDFASFSLDSSSSAVVISAPAPVEKDLSAYLSDKIRIAEQTSLVLQDIIRISEQARLDQTASTELISRLDKLLKSGEMITQEFLVTHHLRSAQSTKPNTPGSSSPSFFRSSSQSSLNEGERAPSGLERSASAPYQLTAERPSGQRAAYSAGSSPLLTSHSHLPRPP